MKAYVFDGSPEEVAQALKAMGMDGHAPRPHETSLLPQEVEGGSTEEDGNELDPEDVGEEEEDDGGPRPLSMKAARHLLKRLPLSEKMGDALIAIYTAGGEGILGSELCEEIDYDAAQFRGMMGAFGRRMVNSKGWSAGKSFFDWSWNADEGYRYRLFESSQKAVEDVLISK